MVPRVLIADAEPWAIARLEAAASRYGAEVSVASNGIEAIERYKRDAPDLIVVDNLLPKVNGLDMIARVRATAPGRVIPAILTSAVLRRDSRLKKLQRQHQFSELLEKPFDDGQAGDALARYLSEDETVHGQLPEPIAELLPGHPGIERAIEGFPLGFWLLELVHERKTGALTLRREGTTRILALERGQVVDARSSSSRERIDRVLARLGRITPEQLRQLHDALAAHKRQVDLTALLVKLGWLWEEEVKGAALTQRTQIVLRTILATHGTALFQEAPLPMLAQRFELRAPELLFWSMRRFDGHGGFRSVLPSPRATLLRTESFEKARATVNLTPLEEQILGLADGRRRLGDLMSIARFGPIDIARVLHCFLSLGLLVAHGEGPAASALGEGLRPRIEPTGSLAQGQAIELLARLWLEHESGRLRLEDGTDWREVVLDRGEPVWASSSRPEDWLGAVLRETGAVTESDLADALRAQTETSGRRIGGILLEQKAVTLEELDRARRVQVQRILASALAFTAGRYHFERAEVGGADRVTLSVSAPTLILDSARRAPAPPAVQAMLASPETVLMKAWDSDQIASELKLERNEKLLLDVLETGRTPVEVVGMDLMPVEELARTLRGLLAIEVVRAVQGHLATKEDTPEAVFEPGELVRGVLGNGEINQILAGEETSGVIHMGVAGAASGTPESRMKALESENVDLRKRLAELERVLREMAKKP